MFPRNCVAVAKLRMDNGRILEILEETNNHHRSLGAAPLPGPIRVVVEWREEIRALTASSGEAAPGRRDSINERRFETTLFEIHRRLV